MKILGHILLIITSALLICCTPPGVDRELDRAEALMEEAPDSALTILQGITLPSYVSSGSRARHALLLSQALDKNYIDLTSDSLILIAERHYEHTSSLRPLMLSYFYHGQILLNGLDFPASLILFTKSLDLAEQLEEEFWQGRATEKLSTIYEKCYHGADEVYFAKESLSHFMNSGKVPHLNYAFLSMARAYYNNDDYDNALKMLAEAEKKAIEAGDSILLSSVYGCRAMTYFHLHRYEEAIDIFEHKIGIDALDDLSLGFLGMSYLESGQVEKAAALVNESEASTMNTLRYMLSKHSGDYKSALEQYEVLFALEDSILSASLSQSFNKSIAELRLNEIRENELRLKNTRLTFFLTILLITLAISLALAVSIRIYKRQKQTIEKNLCIAHNLNEILTFKDNELKEAQESVRELLASRYVVIDSLCQSIYETSGSKRDKKKVSDEIETLIFDLSKNTERIAELEKTINKNHGNIMAEFRKELPNLKDVDYLLYLYTILGFSMTAIALILGEDKIESIYNRKARLKTKIKTLPKEKQERYLEVFG